MRAARVLPIMAAFAWFLLTQPRDRSEAEDALGYASDVESGRAAALLHPHHLFYGPGMRAVYVGLQRAGFGGRAHSAMVAASALSGALSLWLAAYLARRCFGAGPALAWTLAGLLGVSYGFWRYACEAEVYLPAILLALSTLAMAASQRTSRRWSAATGLVAGVAVLFHVLNAFAAFLAAPLFLLLQRRRRDACTVAGVGLAVVLAGYAATLCLSPEFARSLGAGALSPSLGYRRIAAVNVLEAAVGLGQSLLSGTFLFMYPSFRRWIVSLFPGRMLEEEIWLGIHAASWQGWVAGVTLAAILGGTLACVAVVARGARRGLLKARPPGEAALACAAMAWFGFHGAVALISEPGNPEVWIMALPPFWLSLWGLTGAARALGASRGTRRIALVTVVAVAAHNWFGGMDMLRAPGGGYLDHKAAWLAEHARAGDLILTADSPVFVRHLRYWSKAGVVEMLIRDPQSMMTEMDRALAEGRAVYACGDVFSPPAYVAVRLPSVYRRVVSFASGIANQFWRVRWDEFGGVYLHRRRGPDAEPSGTPAPARDGVSR